MGAKKEVEGPEEARGLRRFRVIDRGRVGDRCARRGSSDSSEAGIIAASGWAALTPPALAESLGVHATAAYRHVPSWNDLLVAVFDLSLGRLTEAAQQAEAAGATPRERFTAFLRTVRQAVDAGPYLVDCIDASFGRKAPRQCRTSTRHRRGSRRSCTRGAFPKPRSPCSIRPWSPWRSAPFWSTTPAIPCTS